MGDHEGIGGLLEHIAGGFGEAGHAVMELATGPIGVATAALFGMGEAAKKAWETMHDSFMLARDARTLGMSTTGLKALNIAGEEQGMGEGEASGRMMRFQGKVGAAATGDKAAQGLFKSMDVEVDGKTMEEILSQVAESFEKIHDPAEKARRAIELFGRGGQEMIPVLKEMGEEGGPLKMMGLGDEHTDAVLGGAWKKVHGFFSQVANATKEMGKTMLANVIDGYTGYKGEDADKPNKVKVQESEADKEKKEKAAHTHAENLATAQAQYRREVEATATAQNKLLMLMQDERDIKEKLSKSKDDVEQTKLKTELLQKQHEIQTATATVKKEYDEKHAPAKAATTHLSQHVDASSSAGLFQSISAATNNPVLEVARQQLRHLETIAKNTGKQPIDHHAL